MRENIRLDVANLNVESFETAPASAQPSPVEKLTTCMETDCGKFRCCA